MRGHIRKRGKNSWFISFRHGRDPITGKPRRVQRTIRGKKSDAEKELTKLLSEADLGVVPTSGKITLGEWLDQWLQDVVAHRNQPRTLHSYASIVRNHLTPQIGNTRLSQLEPGHIERLMSRVMASGRTANTALHVFTVLRKALRDAERRGLVSRNICRLVDPPKLERKVIEPPSIPAIKQILAEADKSSLGPVINFMARTGVRRGEAIALRWENLDLERGSASIVESAARVPGKGIEFRRTKSAAGRRLVSLDPITVTQLRLHRAQQDEQVLATGSGYSARDLVFTGPLGRPLDPEHLTQGFKKVTKAAGYPATRLHDLRHAHAAGLFKAGAHPRVVQERLGHSSAAFTMQTYGHVMEGMQEQAARDFADLLETSG